MTQAEVFRSYERSFSSLVGADSVTMTEFADERNLVHFRIFPEYMNMFIAWRWPDRTVLLVMPGGYEEAPTMDEVVELIRAIIEKRAKLVQGRKGLDFLIADLEDGTQLRYSKMDRGLETWERRLLEAD